MDTSPCLTDVWISWLFIYSINCTVLLSYSDVYRWRRITRRSVFGSFTACELCFLTVVFTKLKLFATYIISIIIIIIMDGPSLTTAHGWISVYAMIYFFGHSFYANVTTLRSGLCCRNSVCRLSVCNVGAPYSGGSSFRQNFFTAVYAGRPLTSVQNFTEIVPGEPSVGGVKRKKGIKIERFRTYRRL